MKFILHGRLAEQVGKEFNLRVKTLSEGFRAIEANTRKLFSSIMSDQDGKGYYQILVDNHPVSLKNEEEFFVLRGEPEVHVIPVVAGATTSGTDEVIIGVVILVVAIILAIPSLGGSLGFVAADGSAVGIGAGLIGATAAGILLTAAVGIGISLTLAGIANLLAPVNQGPQPSYVFSGPVNSTAQGNPVPLCYGYFLCGSQVISAFVVAYSTPYNYALTPGQAFNIQAGAGGVPVNPPLATGLGVVASGLLADVPASQAASRAAAIAVANPDGVTPVYVTGRPLSPLSSGNYQAVTHRS